MANKRKRPRPAARSGLTTGGVTATEARSPVPKPALAAPGGPNRLARKEEARRQREALRKRLARRRMLRRVGIVLAVVLVAGALGAYFVLRTTAAEAAGCGGVQTIEAYPGSSSADQAHIGGTEAEFPTPPLLSSYSSTPPASGPHDVTPLPSGIYDTPPDVFRAIHSLEHGAVIAWYRPSAAGEALTDLKAFYQDPLEQDHVIVAPYDYPNQGRARQLPAGKNLVLVSWHRLQSCERVSLGAAQSFVAQFRNGVEAPEAGAPIQ